MGEHPKKVGEALDLQKVALPEFCSLNLKIDGIRNGNCCLNQLSIFRGELLVSRRVFDDDDDDDDDCT